MRFLSKAAPNNGQLRVHRSDKGDHLKSQFASHSQIWYSHQK